LAYASKLADFCLDKSKKQCKSISTKDAKQALKNSQQMTYAKFDVRFQVANKRVM
jgi:S-ribosylhomocysteine lyase LuxS involved in autoinducer biosynthesis